MWEVVEQLKQPILVANVQKFFGVEHINEVNGYGNGDSTAKKEYIVKNKFWYYLFVIGTALGDEIFYASFIPFWFWNIDGAVGRRVVLVWAIIMYCGQGVKDIIKWPRPSAPAIRMQKKWAEEYGMPSTHAMVGLSIPFSVILFTMNRYIYSFWLGATIAILWCSVICISRLYLGMHSVIDIIAGLLFALLLMLPMVPLVDMLDDFWVMHSSSPLILLTSGILLTMYFPHTDVWTPTRGDTTMITSVCVGIHIGAWCNYKMGVMSQYSIPPPYPIFWPNLMMLGLTVLRTILGFGCVLATRSIFKIISTPIFTFVPFVHNSHDKQDVKKTFVELSNIFLTYFMIGFNTVFVLPFLFRLLGIERPTFYTEL